MDRRSFLKTVVCGVGGWALARPASAGRLVLIETTEPDKIVRIEWIRYDAGQGEQRCAVRVTTISGAQGWADLSASVVPDEATEALIDATLLDQDLAHPENLWRRLYEQGLSLATLAALDVALWDLWARRQNTSVAALLGAQRQQIQTCLNTGFNVGEPADYAQLARQCQATGVNAIRIQPYIEWGNGIAGLTDAGFPSKDIAAYTAVRAAVGVDYPSIAANGGTYLYEQALQVGHTLDELDFAWYESPMPETDDWIDWYIALVEQLDTPVCGGQTDPGAYEPRVTRLSRGACDLARISLYHGGFTACRQVALACAAAGKGLALMDVGRDSYPYLALAGTTTESVLRYYELTSLANESETHPGRATPEPVFDTAGHIPLPEGLGMGVELDWRYIMAHRVA